MCKACSVSTAPPLNASQHKSASACFVCSKKFSSVVNLQREQRIRQMSISNVHESSRGQPIRHVPSNAHNQCSNSKISLPKRNPPPITQLRLSPPAIRITRATRRPALPLVAFARRRPHALSDEPEDVLIQLILGARGLAYINMVPVREQLDQAIPWVCRVEGDDLHLGDKAGEGCREALGEREDGHVAFGVVRGWVGVRWTLCQCVGVVETGALRLSRGNCNS